MNLVCEGHSSDIHFKSSAQIWETYLGLETAEVTQKVSHCLLHQWSMTFGTQLEPTCDGLAQKYRLCWHAAHRYILLLIREVNLIWQRQLAG